MVFMVEHYLDKVSQILAAAHIWPVRLWILQHWFSLHPEPQLLVLRRLLANLPSLGLGLRHFQHLLDDGGQGNPGSQLAGTTNPLYCDNHRLSCPPTYRGALYAQISLPKHRLIGEDIL